MQKNIVRLKINIISLTFGIIRLKKIMKKSGLVNNSNVLAVFQTLEAEVYMRLMGLAA